MPFDPVNIDPNDLNPNIAIGINLPLSGPSVFTSTFTTQESIKNNLINFLLTNPGEIPLNPSFGAGLRLYLFEQNNDFTKEDIKYFIQQKIELYFTPSISIINIDASSPDNEPNNININFNYFIPGTNINDNINLQF